MNLEETVAAFAEYSGVLFRPASPTEVASAETAGVPESLLGFYREYEPNETGSAKIRLFPLEEVVAHRTDFLPSCQLARHGYFAFAGTEHGDVYMVNVTGGQSYERVPIYIFSHEVSFSGMLRGQVEEFGTRVADGIPEFLVKAVDGSLTADPL
jgi:hypothetical protein